MPIQQINAPPTTAEATRVNRFIKSRRADIEYNQRKIKEEEEQMKASEAAISNLQASIPLGREFLKVHEENLSNLLQIQSRLSNVTPNDIKMHSEPQTTTMYEQLMARGLAPVARISDIVNEQIPVLQGEVRALWDSVHDMETELNGWQSTLRLSKDAIEQLSISVSLMEGSIQRAKDSFKPFHKLPSDVWVASFRYVLECEVEKYFQGNDLTPLRPTVLVLSSVCRSWRLMVQDRSDLWSSVYVPPTPLWTNAELKRLETAIPKSRPVITLYTNLSQITDNNGTDLGLRELDADSYTDVRREAKQLQDPNYILYFRASIPLSEPLSKITDFPFSQAPTATIRVSGVYDHELVDAWTPFGGVSSLTSLTLITEVLHTLSSVEIGPFFPYLKSLNITAKKFMNGFELTNLLPDTLEELYIRHTSSSPNPFIKGITHLPKLRILGLTAPPFYVLSKLRLPSLVKLTLYGPPNSRTASIEPGKNLGDLFRRIKQISFEQWRKPRQADGSLGAAAVFKTLVGQMYSLKSVAFLDSYVSGDTLFTTLNTLTHSRGGAFGILDELTLGFTTGITRSDCDRIKLCVERMKIYR